MVSPGFTLSVKSDKTGLAVLVVEIDMPELELAEQGGGIERLELIVHLGWRIHQFEDPLRRSDGVLHLGVDSRQILDRPHHEGEV
jgi:hypothetical protein